MFKQSVRIQNPNVDPKEELEKMKEVKNLKVHGIFDFFLKIFFRGNDPEKNYFSLKQTKKNEYEMSELDKSKNMTDKTKNSIQSVKIISGKNF